MQLADAPVVGTIQFPVTIINSPTDLIINVINWLLGICAALAVLAIVYSGIMYITAGTDAKKAETAKKNLTWAIVGIIVIFLAIVLVRITIDITTGNLISLR